jgi:hypothetical protein
MKTLGGFCKRARSIYRVEYLQDFKGKFHDDGFPPQSNTKGVMLADARLFVVMSGVFRTAQSRMFESVIIR